MHGLFDAQGDGSEGFWEVIGAHADIADGSEESDESIKPEAPKVTCLDVHLRVQLAAMATPRTATALHASVRCAQHILLVSSPQ